MDLLANIITSRAKQLNKHWNSTMFNNNPCVLRCTRGNIGQSPGSLKLKSKGSSLSNDKISYTNYFNLNKRHTRHHTCNWGTSCLPRNSTNRGTTPALITSSIGGLRSTSKADESQQRRWTYYLIKDLLRIWIRKWNLPIDNSFLNWVVASNCEAGSSDHTPCTIKGILSNC